MPTTTSTDSASRIYLIAAHPRWRDSRVNLQLLKAAREVPGVDVNDLYNSYPDYAIDVKTEQVESPDLVATRIRRALRFVPPDRLVINPDCGLRHVPADAARAKLRALVAGTAQVRTEQLSGGRHDGPPAGPRSIRSKAPIRNKAGTGR